MLKFRDEVYNPETLKKLASTGFDYSLTDTDEMVLDHAVESNINLAIKLENKYYLLLKNSKSLATSKSFKVISKITLKKCRVEKDMPLQNRAYGHMSTHMYDQSRNRSYSR